MSLILVFFNHKWEVLEAHELSGEDRVEGLVETQVDQGSTTVEPKWVRLERWIVDPGATNVVSALEDHHSVAFSDQLAGGDKTGVAGADDGHVAGDEWTR